MAFRHGKRNITCTVKRTRRKKTIALRVEPDGQVTVLSPAFVSRKSLRKFIQKRSDWVLQRQAYLKEIALKYPPRHFVNGEAFPLFARNYRLRILKNGKQGHLSCRVEGKRILVTVNGAPDGEMKESVRQCLSEFYRKKTERKVLNIIQRHAKKLDVRPGAVNIGNQRSRWGSCSKHGNLRFNWKLSMIPPSVLEYVVVHELCHLKTPNHSQRFWRMLKSVLPAYEKTHVWLKENRDRLTPFLSL